MVQLHLNQSKERPGGAKRVWNEKKRQNWIFQQKEGFLITIFFFCRSSILDKKCSSSIKIHGPASSQARERTAKWTKKGLRWDKRQRWIFQQEEGFLILLFSLDNKCFGRKVLHRSRFVVKLHLNQSKEQQVGKKGLEIR